MIFKRYFISVPDVLECWNWTGWCDEIYFNHLSKFILRKALPILGFFAKRGKDHRKNKIEAFTNALKAVGVDVVDFDGSVYTHMSINNAIGETGETVYACADDVF